jgi:hypothetical protein
MARNGATSLRDEGLGRVGGADDDFILFPDHDGVARRVQRRSIALASPRSEGKQRNGHAAVI